MKPRTTCVRTCLISLSVLACGAALTACGSEEPKPTQNQVNSSNGTPSKPQTPMSDGPPAGTPNTTP